MERITLELDDWKYGARLDFDTHGLYDIEGRAEALAELVRRTYLHHYGLNTILPEETDGTH